jgi:hypothetical protein
LPRPSDQELWATLLGMIALHPVLRPAPGSADTDTTRTAVRWITLTVRSVNDFADAIHTAVESVGSPGPPSPGSARAVGLSVVRMCRAFTRNWVDVPGVTPARVIEFNRGVVLLRTLLERFVVEPEPER